MSDEKGPPALPGEAARAIDADGDVWVFDDAGGVWGWDQHRGRWRPECNGYLKAHAYEAWALAERARADKLAAALRCIGNDVDRAIRYRETVARGQPARPAPRYSNASPSLLVGLRDDVARALDGEPAEDRAEKLAAALREARSLPSAPDWFVTMADAALAETK